MTGRSEHAVRADEAVAAVRAAFAGRDDVRVVVQEGATHGFSQRRAAPGCDEGAERAAMASLHELVAELGAARRRSA